MNITAAEWNKRFPIGTPVRYYPIINGKLSHDSKTRSKAWKLGHGAPVVKIEGRAGGVCLEAIEIIQSTNPEWHKGPPPHVGWWNASVVSLADAWRWWDGQHWSEVVYECSSPAAAGSAAARPEGVGHLPIRWSWRWPENARVARINPDTSEVTGAGPMPCKRCGGVMKEGTALITPATGSHDLGGICTMSPDPRASKLIPCSKCESCGWSVSNG